MDSVTLEKLTRQSEARRKQEQDSNHITTTIRQSTRKCRRCGESYTLLPCGECPKGKTFKKTCSCVTGVPAQSFLGKMTSSESKLGPKPEGNSSTMGTVTWSYGVTTVPQRRKLYLPKTLESLKCGGFDKPTLFIDGITHLEAITFEREFGLEVVSRGPTRIKTFGNWVLALAELYIRNPNSDRYVLFQDDLITYPNLRHYLDKITFPDKGYWNLYTYPTNMRGVPKDNSVGFFTSNQYGKSALGLVFNSTGVQLLLTCLRFIDRPKNLEKGWKNIDGGVISSMKKLSYIEYCHYPSLLQHTGKESAIRYVEKDENLKPARPHPKQPYSPCFLGEDFDALELLKK